MSKQKQNTVSSVFSEWARTGKSDSMSNQHAFSVGQMLAYLPDTSFRFLDIGCGNGWVCRQVARLSRCIKATGLDVATDMIDIARNRVETDKEKYIHGEVMSVELPPNQDVIFAMESLYYMADLHKNIAHLSSLMKPKGRFIFGCDFHRQNPQTEIWSQQLGVPMHYLSADQWKQLFMDAGLNIKVCKHCQDPNSHEGWHREEMGTLIIVAVKPS